MITSPADSAMAVLVSDFDGTMSRDVISEVEDLLDHDPRLSRCFRQ